jgi:hypothetical protein
MRLVMTQKIRLWLSPPDHHTGRRSIGARFGIPHDFPPDLSLPQALIGVSGALARIFLGSLWFAVWGLYSIRAWGAIQSSFWRGAVILPLALLFVLPLAVLMAGISAVVKAISPKEH